MDIIELHRRTVAGWTDRLRAVPAERWHDPTPCPDWDVRALVNHVTSEDRWTVPLMRGGTIAEVGDALDGDVLGDDPTRAAIDAAAAAVADVERLTTPDLIVHLSFGDTPATEYVYQLAADHLIHGWDLAKAVDGDTDLDPELVAEVGRWFAEREEMYRAAGAIGPRKPLTGDPQGDLLAGFGRTA
jgi:uncharacterized protein (TIGR03086 family)